MDWKHILDEAFQKGEKVKEELFVELVHSKLFTELVKNDKFMQAISTVIRTKDEIAGLIQKQIKHFFQFMDIPTRRDIEDMNGKLSRLSHELDHMGSRARLQAGKQAAAHGRKKSKKKR